MGLETPYNPVPDICRGHHGGDELSEAANLAGNKEVWKERTFLAVHTAGLRGCTPEEVAEYLSDLFETEVDVRTVAPRMTELKKEGRIVPTNQRRPTKMGCSARVCVAKVHEPIEYRKPDTREPEPDQRTLTQKWGGEADLSGPEPVKPAVGQKVPAPFEPDSVG